MKRRSSGRTGPSTASNPSAGSAAHAAAKAKSHNIRSRNGRLPHHHDEDPAMELKPGLSATVVHVVVDDDDTSVSIGASNVAALAAPRASSSGLNRESGPCSTAVSSPLDGGGAPVELSHISPTAVESSVCVCALLELVEGPHDGVVSQLFAISLALQGAMQLAKDPQPRGHSDHHRMGWTIPSTASGPLSSPLPPMSLAMVQSRGRPTVGHKPRLLLRADRPPHRSGHVRW